LCVVESYAGRTGAPINRSVVEGSEIILNEAIEGACEIMFNKLKDTELAMDKKFEKLINNKAYDNR